MAWTETYHCDVCRRARMKTSTTGGWPRSTRSRRLPTRPHQPLLRLTPWNEFLSHSADVKHLCGARCAQTELDRWMAPIHESMRAGEVGAAAEEDAPATGA